MIDDYMFDQASLKSANLLGARLNGAGKLITDRPIVQICLTGKGKSTLTGFITDQGAFLKAFGFFGDEEDFKAMVKEKNKNSIYAMEYLSGLEMVKRHAQIWTE